MFTNKMVYLLETLVWMKTKDAQRKPPKNKPKPFVPPFMQGPSEPSEINNGIELHTTEDIKSILAQPRK